MKNKKRMIFITFILLFVLTGLFSLIMEENIFVVGKNKLLRLAGIYTEAIPSVTINQTGYEQQTPGTWGITKSAKWTGFGKAEVTFDVQSIMKTGDNHKDIILVMDISGSMYGEKLEKAKQDSIELVERILSDSNNRIAFITFDDISTIVSPFTNNKETLINQIQNISNRGFTNYNSALKNAKEVLNEYQKQSNKDLVLLFLTDGYPNEDIHNEIATYQILKEKYPYMMIQGIQYEMGTEIHDDIKNISDNQFIANMTTLENVLFEASIAPYLYENFVITDYIHDDYFTVGSVDDIKVSYGSVQLVPEGTGQKVIWDLSGLYRTGANVQMKINLTLKQQYVGGEGFYPTNKGEDISSQLPEESKKEINSDQTPVLQSSYQVIYDSNVPTGCSNQDLPTEKHMVYEVVEKKDTELTCPGYQFKGWEFDLNDSLDIQKINNDMFIMPEHEVTIRGQWTKHNIEKSMDGTIHIVRKVTNLYTDGTLIINDEDIDNNITKHGAIVKEYDGFSEEQPYVFYVPLWYNEREQIKRVEIGEVIQPTSTAYWFYDAQNMEEGDFTNLDTSKVTNMSYMFYNAGRNATTFTLTGLDSWDTSSVTNMSSMFYNAGSNATTFNLIGLNNWNTSQVTSMFSMFYNAGRSATTWNIGNLSRWNTSEVSNMTAMFSDAGRSATTWNIGNLSGWNTSKVTDMSYMFYYAGYSATTWNIGNLSGWDTSQVTYMSYMFDHAGRLAPTFDIGNLSGWDTSKVTSMSFMFSYAGYSATTWNIGNLSGWDTSSVTSMDSMFYAAGQNATTFSLDLSGWDMSQVTSMYSMFQMAGYSATTWNIGNLSGWDTSKVTTMHNMFSAAGNRATTWNSIGSLKVYATDLYSMFNSSPNAKGTLIVYSNPQSHYSGYGGMFAGTATTPGSGITVNYSRNTTNIDAMIATKSDNSNVVKGIQID